MQRLPHVVFKEPPGKRFQQTLPSAPLKRIRGSVAEGPRKQRRFGGSGAEARGSVAEGSPKQPVQTVTGVSTQLFETDTYPPKPHKSDLIRRRPVVNNG